MNPIERWRRLARLGRGGVAALEFALVLPMLLLLALGLSDVILHMRAVYRVERMAGEILNALGQIDPLTGDQVKSVLCAANSIGGSNLVSANLTISNPARSCNLTSSSVGAVHVTALDNNGGVNRRLWTQSSYESVPASVASKLTANPPVLPGGAIVPPGSQVIVVEVLVERIRFISTVAGTVFSRVGSPTTVYSVAVARPRTATLTFSANNRPP